MFGSRRVLLVEPGYKSKYPPLGLMKIATYHRLRDDHVVFVKGLVPEMQRQSWDRVYVSSLFTYYWNETVRTIHYYGSCVRTRKDIYVGGVMATLLPEDLESDTGATIIGGLLDKPGMLDHGDRTIVDALIPDYSILADSGFEYHLQNSYIAYATRGCPRRCEFCAVHRIEPEFVQYLPLRSYVSRIEDKYGPKRDLILLDNNVLASDQFSQIISDVKALGFERGARFSYLSKAGRITSAHRILDFNQGLDARLLTEDKMALLSETAIKPVRIAFDDLKYRELYEGKIRLAAKFGLEHLSNYVLYNYLDRPSELYERLAINLSLNEELGVKVFSYPMRYVSLASKDRLVTTPGNVGPNWNPKFLRAIRCILLRTKGLVGISKPYFEAAFGRDVNEFMKILMMPEDYILRRGDSAASGMIHQWQRDVAALSPSEKDMFARIVQTNQFRDIDFHGLPRSVKKATSHYLARDMSNLHLLATEPGAGFDPAETEPEVGIGGDPWLLGGVDVAAAK